MNYENPELRERLAGEYVLGTMPPLTRRRFERLIAADPQVAQLVAEWTGRLMPIDMATPAQDPPARVWRAVERRVAAGAAAPERRRDWRRSLALWRILALGASAALLAVIVFAAVLNKPTPPLVIAVLDDGKGAASWVALTGPGRDEVSVSALRPLPENPAHSFELWGIAGGRPQPLGLLRASPARPTLVRVAALPPAGGVLAVSLEPAGGSPSGSPTGPVLYQGRLLARPR